jgi:hypothetical protein
MFKKVLLEWSAIILLFLLTSNFVSSLAESEIKLQPTDDAHILADLSDPADTSRLMQTNTGNFDSIEMVSAWNATEADNAFVSIGYLKFDLSKQNNYNLEKAELKMLTREVALSETPKKVVLLHVSNSNWKESDITYLKRPFFSTTVASSAEIAAQNTWYSWDVTELVKQNPGSELSFALTFETGRDNAQDYVSFYSKEFPNTEFWPHLVLSYSSLPTPSFDSSSQDPHHLTSVIISGLIGAAIGTFTTKIIITRGKQKTSKSTTRQSSIQQERVQCKGCGKMLPKFFKFCPFCATKT